jgi:hypothetical protein
VEGVIFFATGTKTAELISEGVNITVQGIEVYYEYEDGEKR